MTTFIPAPAAFRIRQLLQKGAMPIMVAPALLGAVWAVMPYSAQAEAFNEAYTVSTTIVPTPVVAGSQPQPTVIKVDVGPDFKNRHKTVSVSVGNGPYKVSAYTLKLRLVMGPDDSSEDGTVEYQLSADINHTTGTGFNTIHTRANGDVRLDHGYGEAPLPLNKYFSGKVVVRMDDEEGF
ncbi:hypothetical protein E3E12_02000 [Formicincola oecophyllae]|uniref:Uncharacterized protein n=1 Tax=Formicincola oecophyllae TaxID=2558361 RepID=A0A4Y6U782_9PROT|nr:hypothetical protein [Formicincola oecophyllae]QDH13172.1 hypothetical protein E3E12_02000 [Formicincola oecophyllae]